MSIVVASLEIKKSVQCSHLCQHFMREDLYCYLQLISDALSFDDASDVCVVISSIIKMD